MSQALPNLRQLASLSKDRLNAIVASLSGMKRIESLIQSKFTSESPMLSEIPEYLLTLGGKRMRPMLCLMVSRALGMQTPSPQLIDVAAGIEMIHMATLLHDDIIDKSPLRRHKQSAFLKFGVENTLLAGDFLLTRAFSLCAKLDQYIINATEQACVDLTEGEIEEIPLSKRTADFEKYYFIARKKTAALFKLASQSAAHLSNPDPFITESMAQFGESLGVAFQILDDILDVSSSEKELGKRAGQDIREQKPTIVNILWLESGSELAQKLLTLPAVSDDLLIERALKELISGGVLDKAREHAHVYVAKAREALNVCKQSLPDQNGASKATNAAFSDLEVLLDYTIQRME